MLPQTDATPPRVIGFYDEPMWRLTKERKRLHLQCCASCGTWRYPPGPVCQSCLSPDSEWKPVTGGGELLSWIVFHRQYLPAYSPPYNVIAVRLDEGPIIISNLIGDVRQDRLIGRRVRLKVVEMDDGVALPRFELAD